MDYHRLFREHNGIMRTKELLGAGVTYAMLQKLIREGKVEKVRYGYYQWQDERAYTEASVIVSLFPEAVICGPSALMYYDYTDRVPQEWHLAVDNRCERRKFRIDSLNIKPHFIEAGRLKIGMTNGNIDGITVKIYDRERLMCDCLRHVNSMDGEIFNTAIQRYVRDEKKDAARLMEYAKLLGVEKKARGTICIWL